MTDQEPSNPDQPPILPTKTSKAYFPWVVVFVVGALLIALNFFDDLLAEAVNLDPGVRNLAMFLLPLVALTLVGWWYLIRRARSLNWKSLLAVFAVLAPVVFFVLYQPVFGGNANLERFEPRFWSDGKEIAIKPAETKTSRLATTTEYDFPQFLGPDRDGTIRNVKLASWKESPPELIWKQPVGDAWSGFAVVNGYAITQEQRDDQECVVCYEVETGNTVWNYSVTRRHEDFSSFGRVGPRATPTIHDGKVYAVSGTGVLDCLNGEDGSLIWSFDVPKKMGIEQVSNSNSRGLEFTQENSTLTWGRSQSPLIIDDLLILPGGGIAQPDANAEEPDLRVEAPGATLIAINRETGEEVWRGGDRSIAYGSPILATVAGVSQILLIAEDHCVSHDPKTGKELWAWSWPGGSNGAANCSQVTVIDDNTVMISKGYSTGAQVISLENEDGKLIPIPEARDPRALKTKFSNPAIHDGYAYAISDRFLECADAKTLKKQWRHRGFGTGQLLLVGDKLLVHAETGKLSLVTATPESYEELGSVETVDGTCWNTIALFKDLVLVRSEKEAACFRLPLDSQTGPLTQ
ncbi:outer membrane protein assembly factor BamB family protein [Mariniblastus fucicola]|uniref:Outer membrane biogenesis protein BamB n=1 Tax=Mariniblastus fucicola TaxID=980251 RepID=A0A5B9PBI4_9BACT|nr:PQQ-binding-like beta-propeller repeat protein [Mariniblastus fucicola]QEG22360.1 outer membrane biogenesis protein BamB [Mariniblastus fucicola]